ncbi:MAG TPA: DUF2332 domain-containing protein [Acidimicrobiia bacterium]
MAEGVYEDFARWGRHAKDSPLYQALAEAVAGDEELLAVAAEIERPPRPNMLFAAVQFLLSADDQLSQFYASRTESPMAPEGAFPLFKAFVLDHVEPILELGRTRYIQTNEVKRVAALLPAMMREADRLGEPVHVIEVGASAGLNLCLDRYRYDFGGLEFGHSDVVLRVELDGDVDVPTRAPYVQRRVGIDLNPLDLNDPDDLRWLEALIWPEQVERRRRLRAAVRVRATVQVEMVRADASSAIGGVLDRLPTGGPALVFHALTVNQFSNDARERFDRALESAAARRSISRIGFEYWDGTEDWPEIRVGLTEASLVPMMQAHPHGDWIRAL